MNDYEWMVHDELTAWKETLCKRPNLVKRFTKKTQTKINAVIPDKVHKAISDSIKTMVKATLSGSNIISRKQRPLHTLYEKDKQLQSALSTYRKTAVAEGAGTGAGGLLMGLADFPLLLSIKIKFLYDAAYIYGFDPRTYEERLFILQIFQLAFSNDAHRRKTLYLVENWEKEKESVMDMDWQVFQQEYRDYIDLAKMLQLIPGFGAIVGAYANYNLLDHLGETAMNVYRMRILQNQ
ncbi:EcsC family protein [Virgibacillus halophilus]|uniref:EcsC family protein n=1 Tax=Tigheibacillus halophilus TaxID=361280 RepID=UPI003642B2FD